MILDTFTEQEMIKEFDSEFEYVAYAIEKKFTPGWRRTVIKSKSFPIIKQIEYKTPKNNKILINLIATGKKSSQTHTFIGCLIHYPQGYGIFTRTAFEKSAKGEQITHGNYALYLPHFFARYKKRENLEESGNELITHFFSYNSVVAAKIFKKEGYPEGNFIGIATNGFQLGEITPSKKLRIFKTYVSSDMFSEEQKAQFLDGSKCLEENFDALQKCMANN